MPNISASFGFLDISLDTTFTDVAQDISFVRPEDPLGAIAECGLTALDPAARGEAKISRSVK
jgi:hypothetical protein